MFKEKAFPKKKEKFLHCCARPRLWGHKESDATERLNWTAWSVQQGLRLAKVLIKKKRQKHTFLSL